MAIEPVNKKSVHPMTLPGAETRGAILAPGGCDSAPRLGGCNGGKSWLGTNENHWWVGGCGTVGTVALKMELRAVLITSWAEVGY